MENDTLHNFPQADAWENFRIAYVSGVTYPSAAASALQTMQMAAAFNRYANTTLYVYRLGVPANDVMHQYGINVPLNVELPRGRRALSFLLQNPSSAFNAIVAGSLAIQSMWRRAGKRNVLFVRSRKEGLFWGRMRSYLWWMRDWIMVYELHDINVPLQSDMEFVYDQNNRRIQRTRQAMPKFDLVLTVTEGLASDIQTLTQGKVVPHVVPGATGLPRISEPRTIKFSPERVTLGYIGLIDQSHGVGDLLEALKRLPERYFLRFVGRVADEHQAWFNALVNDPALAGRVEVRPRVAYAEVINEIDACDVVLAPAGNTLLSHRYRSPLKLFDYMARGRLIVAASVNCHQELLRNGIDAELYTPGDPEHLAACIQSVVEQPQKAQALSHSAWELSAKYTYDARAKHILTHIEEVERERQSSQIRTVASGDFA